MNKAGKSNKYLMLGGIALIGILGLMVYMLFFGTPQIQLGGQTNQPSDGIGYISTGATTLSINGVDALASGTSVASTNYVGVNGGSLKAGVTSVSPGDKLELLIVNGTTYHNAYIASALTPAAPTFVINNNNGAALNGNASLTMTIYNVDNQVLTNAAAGGVNQTISTGDSKTVTIRMDGQDRKSTQDMVCILESTNSAKVDKLILSGLDSSLIGSSKPASYSVSATTSGIWVYNVAPIVGAQSKTGTIQILSKSGQDASGTVVYVTCLTKEHFIDSVTGKVAYDIEDTSGTAQSMASYKYAFVLQ